MAPKMRVLKRALTSARKDRSQMTRTEARVFCFAFFDPRWDEYDVELFLSYEGDNFNLDLTHLEMLWDVHSEDGVLRAWRAGYADFFGREALEK